MILNRLAGRLIHVMDRDILMLVVVSVDYEEGSLQIREISILVAAL